MWVSSVENSQFPSRTGLLWTDRTDPCRALVHLEVQVVVKSTPFVEHDRAPRAPGSGHVLLDRKLASTSPAQDGRRLPFVDGPLVGLVVLGLGVAQMARVVPVAALEANRDDVLGLVVMNAPGHVIDSVAPHPRKTRILRNWNCVVHRDKSTGCLGLDNRDMVIVIGPQDPGSSAQGNDAVWRAVTVENGVAGSTRSFAQNQLSDFVSAVHRTSHHPDRIRWVWSSTNAVYPSLLRAGVSVSRCWDLALNQTILRNAATLPSNQVQYSPAVDLRTSEPAPAGHIPPRHDPQQVSLFDAPTRPGSRAEPGIDQLVEEFAAQKGAVDDSPGRQRLTLLLAAESQGALIAAEMYHEGLPWNADIHQRILHELLGPRPAEGERPALMQELAEDIGRTLGTSRLNPDSPQDLLRALHSAGIEVSSTRKWDLMAWADRGGSSSDQRRAMIGPVLRYKQLYRLWTANGWHWLDEWVRDGRFHAAYVVGGVVTGRWAAHGGGAMQIPQTVRDAVRADPGNVLTVADASQVEPRILAAMSSDRALAVAGQGKDLYVGIAEIGQRTGSALKDRPAAKVALLGAMYGATSGEAGSLAPHLKRLFPEAIGVVENAADRGERGGQVTTWLGRTSPPPDQRWFDTVKDVSTASAEARSNTMARSQGRFTRNFVVQGTAAEWALCWMGEIRRRLRSGGEDGGPMSTSLVFFVHDEVVLHGPESEAQVVADIVRESAASAGRLLFGDSPVDFPLTVETVDSYAEAK